MRNTIRKEAKFMTWLCALVYFSSYVMRINFAVMLVKICSDMQVEKSAIAIVITCFTVTYGTGQIISGLLGDKFKPQNLLTVGMILAIICNISMFFATSIPLMAAIWAVNGFAHALYWPPIVKLFSSYMNGNEYSYGVVRVSWGSSIATICLYLICPFSLSFMSWRQIILSCAVVGMVVLVLWLIIHPKVFKNPINHVMSSKSETAIMGIPSEKSKTILPKLIYLPIGMIILSIILQGVLRDGVTNWMPSFLLESFGLPEEKAIVATVILAIFSVISFGLFEWIYRKFFKNEVNCAAFIFCIAAATSVILYIVHMMVSSVIVTMLLMAIIVACMHGINLMLIGIVPKRFVKVNKVATFSGILNSGTYIGASVSTYVFAVLAEKFGWNFTIFTWIVVAALGILACKAAVWTGWTKKYKDYLD